jgi:diketogulonate reductase-like aldo/keto reductase
VLLLPFPVSFAASAAVPTCLSCLCFPGYIPLPKSVQEARMTENASIFDFELSGAAMSALDALDERLATSEITQGAQLEPY